MKFRGQLVLFMMIMSLDICLGAGLFYTVSNHDKNSKGSVTVFAEESEPETRVIALTFDDGPNMRYTERLLDGLKERGVKASFFLLGDCIKGNEDIVKRIGEEGHLIGVHGMRHTDLTKESLKGARDQIEETRRLISEVTGKTPEYVRPPYGSWNEALADGVDMETVFWSVDSLDWKLQNTSRIVRKVEHDVENGSVILMHDVFASSVEAAFQIIDNLLANGYTFVTVDELTID